MRFDNGKRAILSAYLVISLALAACGRTDVAEVTIGNNSIDFCRDFSEVVSKLSDMGYYAFCPTVNKVYAPDGSVIETLDSLEVLKSGKVVYVSRGENPAFLSTVYGFRKSYISDVAFADGLSLGDTVLDAIDKHGYTAVGNAAVKIFSDGKEVPLSDYHDIAMDYSKEFADTTLNDFVVNRGLTTQENVEDYTVPRLAFLYPGLVIDSYMSSLASLSAMSMASDLVVNLDVDMSRSAEFIEMAELNFAAMDIGEKAREEKVKNFCFIIIPRDDIVWLITG